MTCWKTLNSANYCPNSRSGAIDGLSVEKPGAVILFCSSNSRSNFLTLQYFYPHDYQTSGTFLDSPEITFETEYFWPRKQKADHITFFAHKTHNQIRPHWKLAYKHGYNGHTRHISRKYWDWYYKPHFSKYKTDKDAWLRNQKKKYDQHGLDDDDWWKFCADQVA